MTRRPVLQSTAFQIRLTVTILQNATRTPGDSARFTSVELSENATTSPMTANTPSVLALRAGVRVGVSGDWPAARGATLTGGLYRGGTATQAERRDAEAGYSVHAPHSQGLSGMRERAELRSAS